MNHLPSLLNRTALCIEECGLFIWRTTLSVAHATLSTESNTYLSGNMSRKPSLLEGTSQKLGTRCLKGSVPRKSQVLEVFYSFASWLLQKRYTHQARQPNSI